MTDPRDMNISELQAETTRCESALGEAETIAADLRARLSAVRAELARRFRPSPEPRISDHALLRYVERVLGIDIEALREEILTENVRAALKAGASGVTVNGVKMVAKEACIVTVLSDDMRPKNRTKRGWRDLDDTDERLADIA